MSTLGHDDKAPKVKKRRSLSGQAKDEPNPDWRRFFMEVDNRRKALTDRKKKPLVISTIETDGQSRVVARQKADPTVLKKYIKIKIPKAMGSRLAGDLEWLREIWPRVVDAEVAAASEVWAFKNGIITVTVFSSSILQEIRQFHQEAILEDLRSVWKASVPLVKIRYRAGKAQI